MVYVRLPCPQSMLTVLEQASTVPGSERGARRRPFRRWKHISTSLSSIRVTIGSPRTDFIIPEYKVGEDLDQLRAYLCGNGIHRTVVQMSDGNQGKKSVQRFA